MLKTYGELEGEVEHANSWLDTRSHQSETKIFERLWYEEISYLAVN